MAFVKDFRVNMLQKLLEGIWEKTRSFVHVTANLGTECHGNPLI